jgi:rRNA maturation endonuclease Nob1
MKDTQKRVSEKLLVRACHSCAKLNEATKEVERCAHCGKAFLPLNYFEKIHALKDSQWQNHFSAAEQLDEEDLIKGLFVLW